ncbi:MAG TPA: L,D-transpeptidase family protein [Allosphingosinicella sp.]
MSIKTRTGRVCRPVHLSIRSAFLATAIAFTVLPTAAHAESRPALSEAEVRVALQDEGGKKDVRAFYKARDYRPLWVSGTVLRPEANRLLQLIESADLDGLNPRDYDPKDLAQAMIEARSGSAEKLAEAEMKLSRALADYARDVARPGKVDMLYVDKELAPKPLDRKAVLDAAAAAPSLKAFLDSYGWMNPAYGKLRTAFQANIATLAEQQRQTLRLNLERLRALPANPGKRYVLVDAAAARLWLYDNDRPIDSMKVIVGKEAQQTPMMAGFIRYAMVNPYWNVPPDLVAERIAPNVLDQGLSYLDEKGYQILSDWSDTAVPLDPALLDWRAIAAGRQQVRVRQLPGPANAMGRMKFMFPNPLGVYLHDTPDKSLFNGGDRRHSAGCVRVEDAPRLARWLFGKPVRAPSTAPEQQVNLPSPVPVYITYLTAAPEGNRIAFREDIYHRDGISFAAASGRSSAGR